MRINYKQLYDDVCKEGRKLFLVEEELLEACKSIIEWAEKGTPINLIQELDLILIKVKQAISKAEDLNK